MTGQIINLFIQWAILIIVKYATNKCYNLGYQCQSSIIKEE